MVNVIVSHMKWLKSYYLETQYFIEVIGIIKSDTR